MEPVAIVLFALFWLISTIMKGAGRKGRPPARRSPAAVPPLEDFEMPPEAMAQVLAPAVSPQASMVTRAKPRRAAGAGVEGVGDADSSTATATIMDLSEPGTMLAGIILSEVLGPPKSRRSRGFSRFLLRNRL